MPRPQLRLPLSLIAARARALGVEFDHGHRLEAAALRSAEPWFAAGYEACGRVWTGAATDADFGASAPFFHPWLDDPCWFTRTVETFLARGPASR
ncbi:hypothetical protein OG978_37145 [Streptomyces sp. NBC_01591]|uniref:hypothetical protein n=1 Tax=Streptomyces sp. NBC_01591 TaxID=2975888 RepID=UPI002DD9645E|nr:hypothetical protein [Streptomyces sp. NBC_01591]WSD72536.1 hypothetical protein OG978_37145 [Streptomyces sp. NBC_01591]